MAWVKHRMSYSREYSSWLAMKKRCLNPNHRAYKNYGGRGIKICGRWLGEDGFYNFFNDMGIRPLNKTLDRFPNRDGNYEPTNCRWASWAEQANNRKGTHPLNERKKLNQEYQKAYRLKNKEKMRLYFREYARKYRLENKDRLNKLQVKSRLENREKNKEKLKLYNRKKYLEVKNRNIDPSS